MSDAAPAPPPVALDRIAELERELRALRTFFAPEAAQAPGPPAPSEDAGCDEDLLLCRAGGRAIAVSLDVIREVVPVAKLMDLPHAERSVLGALNLRGAPVVVHDLALRLTGERADWTRTDLILVCEHRGRRFGLKVTSADDVVRRRVNGIRAYDDDALDDALVRGVIVERDDQVVVLDLTPFVGRPHTGQVG